MSLFKVEGWDLPRTIVVGVSKEKERKEQKKQAKKEMEKQFRLRKKEERERREGKRIDENENEEKNQLQTDDDNVEAEEQLEKKREKKRKPSVDEDGFIEVKSKKKSKKNEDENKNIDIEKKPKKEENEEKEDEDEDEEVSSKKKHKKEKKEKKEHTKEIKSITESTIKEKKHKNKKESESLESESGSAPAPAPTPAPSAQIIKPKPIQKPKLTPLQQKMMEKLSGSRFRWINEQLYTTTSEQAVQIIKNQPEMFDEYHTGFRNQIKLWPENPVDVLVEQVRFRMLKPIGAPGGMPGERDGTINMADMGCGEANFALKLSEYQQELEKSERKRLKAKKHARPSKLPKFAVHSFDLKKANERITVADIKNVPLEDESVNVVVFCLALMGTNFLDFIKEGIRILKPNGEIWIAEIKSRFSENDTKEFVTILKSLGLFHKSTDDANKMFVRMEFFKPNKQYLEDRDKKEKEMKKKRRTFEEYDEEGESLDQHRSREAEGKWLLKPCLYKRRGNND